MKNCKLILWLTAGSLTLLLAITQSLYWLAGGLTAVYALIWFVACSTWKPIAWARARSWLRIPAQFLGLFSLAILLRLFCFEIALVPSASMRNSLIEGDRIVIFQLTYGPRLPRTIVDVPWLHPIYLWLAGSEAYRKELMKRTPHERLAGLRSVERADILVFNHPGKREELYIKRCVGLPGDSLQILDGQVWVNGLLEETPATLLTPEIPLAKEAPPYGWLREKFCWNADQFGPVWVPQRGMKIELGPREKAIYGKIIQTFERDAWRDNRAHDTISLPDTYTFRQDYYFALGDNRTNSWDSRFWGFIPADYIKGRAGLVLFSKQGKWPRFFE